MSDRAWHRAEAIAFGPWIALAVVFMLTQGTVSKVAAILAIVLLVLAAVSLFLIERRGSTLHPRRGVDRPERGEQEIPLDLGVRWDSESPEAWLVQRNGAAALILRPHPEDTDRRLVVLVWTPCVAAVMTPPRIGGRTDAGSASSTEIRRSSWVTRLVGDQRASLNGDTVSDLRHFVVCTHDRTVEVAAGDVTVRRLEAIKFADAAADL